VGYGNVYIGPAGAVRAETTKEFILTYIECDTCDLADTIIVADDTVIVGIEGSDENYDNIRAGIDYLVHDLNLSDFSDKFVASRLDKQLRIKEKVGGLTVTIKHDTISTLDTTIYEITPAWTYFPVFNKPSFAMYNDKIYIANGSSKGVVYDGDAARSWPPNAPGEPSIIPIKVDGPLDGEYRYAFAYRYVADSGSLMSVGATSNPIRVDNGQVILKDFGWPAYDSLHDTVAAITLVGYRTKVNPGPINEGDYAFSMGTIMTTASVDSLADLVYIDSLSDAELSTTDSVKLVSYEMVGRNDTGVVDVKYGAVGFMDFPTWAAGGIFKGIPAQKDTLGVAYLSTVIDTITNTESNAGPVSYIWVDEDSTAAGEKPSSIQISIPQPPDTGLVRNLYRAHILQITYDTAFSETDLANGYYEIGGKTYVVKNGKTYTLSGEVAYPWKGYMVDTVVTSNYYLVSQVANNDSLFTDSVAYDSLTTRNIYVQSTPSTGLTKIFSGDGRMFGTMGSRLYMSRLDSASYWGALGFISLNEDDGDQITDAWMSRGVIRVLKNRSSFNVYQSSDLDWSRTEVSSYLGDIAPYSHAASPMGHYYLTSRGVVRESEGQFLERTQAVELVSAPLANFTSLPIATLKDAKGFYYDQKYLLCIGDTTYVYDERANAWSTWGFKFADATRYGTEEELNFLPGDSMYFTRPGSSNIYRYGTDERDNGSAIAMTWKSVPLLTEDPTLKEVTTVGLSYVGYGQRSGLTPLTSTYADSILVALYDGKRIQITPIGTNTSYTGYALFDSLNNYYDEISVLPHEPRRAYQVQITTNSPSGNSHTVINSVDLWWKPWGRSEVK
jgi:hypothetical protein